MAKLKVADVVARFGGLNRFSIIMGVTKECIYGWDRVGGFPEQQGHWIEALSEGQISLSQLPILERKIAIVDPSVSVDMLAAREHQLKALANDLSKYAHALARVRNSLLSAAS